MLHSSKLGKWPAQVLDFSLAGLVRGQEKGGLAFGDERCWVWVRTLNAHVRCTDGAGQTDQIQQIIPNGRVR